MIYRFHDLNKFALVSAWGEGNWNVAVNFEPPYVTEGALTISVELV